MAKKAVEVTTDLVPVSQYHALAKAESIRELVEINMAGESFGPGDLDRIKFPSGESTMFIKPSLDEDEIDQVKEIVGVILFHKTFRGYWKGAGATNSPPDCHSDDCITGIGDPGGSCQTCHFAQFGTAIKSDGTQGRGQACSMKRAIFIMTDEGVLPTVMNVPAASLKAAKKYLADLTFKKSLPVHGVLSKFTLRRERSQDGTAYPELVIKAVKVLEPKEVAQIEKYIDGIKPMLIQASSAVNMTEDGTVAGSSYDTPEYTADDVPPPQGPDAFDQEGDYAA